MAEPVLKSVACASVVPLLSPRTSAQKPFSGLPMAKCRPILPVPMASRRPRYRACQRDSSGGPLKTQQPNDRPGGVMREAPPPHSIILIYRKPLSSIAYRLQPINKCIVRFYRGLNRNIVRLVEADGLQQFASNVRH